jgi:transposase
MAKTSVVCSVCRHVFPSPIAFGSRKSFETATLIGNVVTCPKCGSPTPCNKENMIFED